VSKRFCLPEDGHSCDTCLWHYDDIWHTTECPHCCHAPEHVAAPCDTPAIDEDGQPCTCTEMGPRPCHWWPRVMLCQMEGAGSSPDYERTAERQAVAEHTGIPLDEICQREYDGIPRNLRYFMRDGEAFVSWQDGLGLNPNQIYRERLLKAVTPSE